MKQLMRITKMWFPSQIERHLGVSSTLAVKEWQRLPSIISLIHVGRVQEDQQIMEVQVAVHINQGFQPDTKSSLHNMMAIV